MRTLIRRSAESLLLLWLVVSLTFVLAHLAPGDAADLLVPPSAAPADVARIRHDLGLDASLPAQYARWIGGVLRGDFGESFATREPVRRVLARALPVSLALGGVSLALTFAVGVTLGLWQAARAGTWKDRSATVISMTVFAAPSYWLALAAVALFTYGASQWGFPGWLRLPAFGLRSPASIAEGSGAWSDIVRHAVLPVTVLSAIGAAGIARYARSAALDLLDQEWVRTARAKGLTERRVFSSHLLRNALPPLVVLFALSLPGVVAGSVFIEGIFAWPGMGRAMLVAIASRDHPVVLGATVLYATMVIAANALSDLALVWTDPRRQT